MTYSTTLGGKNNSFAFNEIVPRLEQLAHRVRWRFISTRR
jgi:hypothetical protein